MWRWYTSERLARYVFGASSIIKCLAEFVIACTRYVIFVSPARTPLSLLNSTRNASLHIASMQALQQRKLKPYCSCILPSVKPADAAPGYAETVNDFRACKACMIQRDLDFQCHGAQTNESIMLTSFRSGIAKVPKQSGKFHSMLLPITCIENREGTVHAKSRSDMYLVTTLPFSVFF